MLIYGIFIAVAGLSLALWPHRRAQAVERRIAEGGDHFFEEQRSYRAYPWMHNQRHLRIAGIVCAVCGLIVCALEFLRP